MVNTCFCAAFGVSLEGLILVNYLTVTVAGVSDETLGLLAKGEFNLIGAGHSARPTALMMALPMIFATYSSLFLLIGSVVMVTQGPQGGEFANYINAYHFLSLIPVGIGFLCMCGTVIVCEVGTYYEFSRRRRHERKQRNRTHATSVGVAFIASPTHSSRYSQDPGIFHQRNP
jgi:hypothetical protein